jgi:hypothetical protein
MKKRRASSTTNVKVGSSFYKKEMRNEKRGGGEGCASFVLFLSMFNV